LKKKMMRTTMKTTFAFLILLLAGSSARAQMTVDQRRAAEPDGLVEIENPAGSIHVVGWDKNEVVVTGTLGSRAEGLGFSGGAHRTTIEVETEGNPHSVRSDLKIQVPAGSRLEIEGFASTIRIEGVNGPVQAETVNGTITMTGGSKDVELQSVNGSVEVTSPATRVYAEAVNGSVTVRNASGEVEASTVNGTLTVIGGTFTRAQLETVSGRIVFEGSLGKTSSLDAESVSGSVELALPATVSADFSISSFSGDIENELGPPPQKASRWTSEKELSFSTGSGGAKVTVETLSGNIRLRKRP
jgi:DUF4097 and DUF4098 domain-containing protein YvlB